jgi:hypothetical protein
MNRHPLALSLGLERIRENSGPIINNVTNNPKCGYITTVTVGTPPQKLDLLMDTGSANIFFGATGCTDCKTPLFNPSSSASLNGSGKFDMFDWCEGEIGEDILALSPTTSIKQQKFGM